MIGLGFDKNLLFFLSLLRTKPVCNKRIVKILTAFLGVTTLRLWSRACTDGAASTMLSHVAPSCSALTLRKQHCKHQNMVKDTLMAVFLKNIFIWVSLPRTGKTSKIWHIILYFLKLHCDQTAWFFQVFSTILKRFCHSKYTLILVLAFTGSISDSKRRKI